MYDSDLQPLPRANEVSWDAMVVGYYYTCCYGRLLDMCVTFTIVQTHQFFLFYFQVWVSCFLLFVDTLLDFNSTSQLSLSPLYVGFKLEKYEEVLDIYEEI